MCQRAFPAMVNKVHAAHILVKSEKEANEILARVTSGEKFPDLAKEFSQCPSGKSGGDLGWFGRNMMVKEFESAAFSGSKGQVVGPIKTQFGWHLIQIIDQN
jgi:peptidyl-prolyl cis-trans isomerase C